jgi:NitT/TauT family transport system substrate-binding protein
MHRRSLLLGAVAAPFVARHARAAEKIKVATFPSASSLPFYVAQERGFFAEAGIEAEGVLTQTAPLIVQAMVTGDVQAVASLVSLEGANINSRRADSVLYFSLNGQNATHRVEQIIVRPNHPAQEIVGLRGARIMCAPGPANLAAARGVLRANGLEETRDYTLVEQQMGVHVGAMQSNQFDAAYTLDPIASIAIRLGAARLLEGGVIAKYLLGGGAETEAYAAGGGITGKFLAEQPALARAYIGAVSKACAAIATDPSVRNYLTPFMNTPAELAPTIPLPAFRLVREMSAAQIASFQRFVDLGVSWGVVRGAIDVHSFLRAL